MAAAEGEVELADAPASYKSAVWQHYGFQVSYHYDIKSIGIKYLVKNASTN
jgi:hypothetical protein